MRLNAILDVDGTVAVLTGGFSEAELREAGAIQVVETIADLDFDSLFAGSARN